MRSVEKRMGTGWAAVGFGRVIQQMTALTTASLIALSSAGCGDEEPKDEHPDRGDITVSYRKAPDEISAELAEAFEDNRLLEDVAKGLNDSLKLPVDLAVTNLSCGEVNAFYDPSKQALSMCYELLTTIAKVSADPSLTNEQVVERIVGTWMFVFFHELGHGLADLYELAITGREEDAVDEFSTILLIEAGLADYAIHAARFWAATDTGVESPLDFADEHSINAQRFYSILCLVYGSDPDEYEELVSAGILPESRAVRCEDEYTSKRRSWDTLLAPWEKK